MRHASVVACIIQKYLVMELIASGSIYINAVPAVDYNSAISRTLDKILKNGTQHFDLPLRTQNMWTKGLILHHNLWDGCNGWASQVEIIDAIKGCEAQGIAWWICPAGYDKLKNETLFCHLNLGRIDVLRYAWPRIASQVSLLDKFGRTAEECALETGSPLETLWLIRRESLYCFMGIWRLRRNECALGSIPRDVIMIIARLCYAPNHCRECAHLMPDDWRAICSCCGASTQTEPHDSYNHDDIECEGIYHRWSSKIICDDCMLQCDMCSSTYCVTCKPADDDAVEYDGCPKCKD